MNTWKKLISLLVLSLAFSASAFASEKVNINTADVATLDRVLVGVGPSKAEAIVAYRKANGPFRSADQLVNVKGIGLATLEENRDRILVGAPPAAKSSQAKTASTNPINANNTASAGSQR